jgi:hypothetical protein
MTKEANIKEVLEYLGNRKADFLKLTRLSVDQKSQYLTLLNHLKHVNDNRINFTTVQIGKALEDVVSSILNTSVVFEVFRNIHTSTNEIDQLITLSFEGREFRKHINIQGEHFISECKNYNGSISVTWVGKFYSLVHLSHCRLGVLFSYNGLSGQGWADSVGLTKKIFLSKEALERKIYLIDFKYEDYERIADGASFLELLEAKMLALAVDTDFASVISKHPAEPQLKSLQGKPT